MEIDGAVQLASFVAIMLGAARDQSSVVEAVAAAQLGIVIYKSLTQKLIR